MKKRRIAGWWIMYKNSALLSISAALLFSLFCIDVGFAFQIDRNQNARVLTAGETKGRANPPTTQVSNTPNPCTESGQGRTGAPGKQRCPLGSGAMAPDGSRYTSQVSNTPTPCGGRTESTCTKQSPPVSGEQAKVGALHTTTTILR